MPNSIATLGGGRAIGDRAAAQPLNTSPGDAHIRSFSRVLSDLEDGLRDCLKLRRMGAYRIRETGGCERLFDELVNYLSFCVSGDLNPIAIPPCAMYLDALLGVPELWTGDTPKLGDSFVAIAALETFVYCKGLASRIIDRLMWRRAKGLATLKQVRYLRRLGHPHPERAPFEEASDWISLQRRAG